MSSSALVAQLAGAGQLRADLDELAVRGDDGLQAGELAAQAAELRRVGQDLGRAQLGADVVVLAREILELGVEAGRRRPSAGERRVDRDGRGRLGVGRLLRGAHARGGLAGLGHRVAGQLEAALRDRVAVGA